MRPSGRQAGLETSPSKSNGLARTLKPGRDSGRPFDVEARLRRADGEATSTIASFIVATGLFGLVYKIIPDVDVEWRDVTLGALMTSLLFNVGKLLVGIYLGKTSLAS